MTAFALTGEQQDFAERVRSIASGQLRALAEAGTPGHVNRAPPSTMGDSGLLARLFPGIGADGLSREAAELDRCRLRESLVTRVPKRRSTRGCGLGSPAARDHPSREPCGLSSEAPLQRERGIHVVWAEQAVTPDPVSAWDGTGPAAVVP